eukprot:TRINITY_DN11064_c0_g1_i1.p1 TRINITY_DN11064_c0_g1~~TRINITY_DN11064_c0_g1_i1.p1  ORF type:complete len:255 (+),score=95.98 TRINITY_DN11064_c0_g1_i1:67-831(+)
MCIRDRYQRRVHGIQMMQQQMCCLILAAIFAVSSATKGVDYSTRVSDTKCMVKEGYTYAIPRAYCSYGGVDANAVANIKNAWDGGMSSVDVYMFPCVPCGNPKKQVDQLVDALASSKYGMIWFDIEKYKWSENKETNKQFILDSVHEIKAKGKKAGIYTSYYNWESIVGLSWDGVKDLPLWYAHYDNNPSFNDFKGFGGWKRPTMKQYAGDKTLCGHGVDFNFSQSNNETNKICLLYTSPSPRDLSTSRMPSSA